MATRRGLSRREFLRVGTGVFGLSLLAACAPAAPAPSPTAPAKAAATQPPSKPAAQPSAQPSAVASPSPGASPAAAAKPVAAPADWERQWDQLIAGARSEGKVVVYGPPNADVRVALSEAFKKRFSVDLEYNAIAGNEAVARITSERAAGVYSTDAILSGADSMMRALAAEGKVADGVMGTLAPILPILILPEVLDLSKYRTGKIWFSDPQNQYILRLSNYAEVVGAINTERLALSALTSLNDLADPKYKGKISAHDPSVPGRGLAVASALYTIQGEEFLKKLFLDQDTFLSREQRQVGDQLVRGNYEVAIGLERSEVDRLVQDGFKIAEMSHLPGYVGAGFGLLGLLDKAPHPNGAKLFVNWIASAEGARVFQEAQRHVSVRNDLDTSSFPDFVVPKPGVQYLDAYDWDYVMDKRAKAQVAVQGMLGRR